MITDSVIALRLVCNKSTSCERMHNTTKKREQSVWTWKRWLAKFATDTFMELADSSGFMRPMDRYVVQRAMLMSIEGKSFFLSRGRDTGSVFHVSQRGVELGRCITRRRATISTAKSIIRICRGCRVRDRLSLEIITKILFRIFHTVGQLCSYWRVSLDLCAPIIEAKKL